MGSYYINRTFFFDVHPPLGKVSSVAINTLLSGQMTSKNWSQVLVLYLVLRLQNSMSRYFDRKSLVFLGVLWAQKWRRASIN